MNPLTRKKKQIRTYIKNPPTFRELSDTWAEAHALVSEPQVREPWLETVYHQSCHTAHTGHERGSQRLSPVTYKGHKSKSVHQNHVLIGLPRNEMLSLFLGNIQTSPWP